MPTLGDVNHHSVPPLTGWLLAQVMVRRLFAPALPHHDALKTLIVVLAGGGEGRVDDRIQSGHLRSDVPGNDMQRAGHVTVTREAVAIAVS